MASKKLIFGVPNFDKRELNAVKRILNSRWVGFGDESMKFEKELRDYVRTPNGILVNSCTAALHLALIANNVKPGDEIITTPLTYAATANVILYLGARPRFVDIKMDMLNIDENKIEKAINKKTKGIIVVHFGGNPCNMKKINAIARRYNLFVVEDAAHALGAKLNGIMIGNTNNIACFSFYANKNLTSIEGGFMSSRNKDQIDHAKILRMHGLSENAWRRFSDRSILTYEVEMVGYKYNTTDVNSAIGRVQLSKLEPGLKKRQLYARTYDKVLSGIDGITLQKKEYGYKTRSALHLYTVVIDSQKFKATRDDIVMELRDRGIFAVIHYKPVHLHKFYRETFGYKKGDFAVAELVGNNIFTLPLLPQMSLKDAQHIARTTKSVLLKYKL